MEKTDSKHITEPLISVVILTYNSSKTVVETLESIYNQTYCRLELIVSDDKSTDNTVDICQNWMEKHRHRFENVQILVPEINTGTAANFNRGSLASHGEWIKGIAGDDLLIPDGIEKLYRFAEFKTEANIVCGKVDPFGLEIPGYDRMVWNYNFKLYKVLESAEEQNWYLMRRNFIAAPGVMLKKKLWESIGGYDEDIPLIEDWPMWMRITKSGHKIFFTDDIVAKYRLTTTSVRSTNYLFSYNVQLLLYKYIYEKPVAFKRLQKMTFLKKRTLWSAIVYRYLGFVKPVSKYPW